MRTFLALFLATIITPSILAATKSKQNLSTVISTSQTIDIAYLNQKQLPPTETLSNLDLFVTNKGLEGAELAISDNNTTGEFTHQKFILHKFNVAPDGSPLEFFKQKIFGKFHYVITNLSATNTLAISNSAENFDTIIFDSGTVDDSLRNENCRGNTLHLLPSRAMKADALAQYMMKKRWSKWFLVIGNTAEDELFDKEFIPLDQARAEQMFTPQSLRQQVKSPWEIVQLQVITTFWFTIIAVIWSFIETNNGLVISTLCGGLVGILPTIAFIMRLGIYPRNSKNNASQFVGRLIMAEVIKISITLILIVLVVVMYDDLEWLPFLAMYIITLQSYWIIGLKRKN